jgi:hypothetical protein
VIDKETLLKPRLPEAVVEIPGLGEVRIRGLSRTQVQSVLALHEVDPGRSDPLFLSYGLVDPSLTEEEATLLLNSTPVMELQPVFDKIKAISGLEEGAEKAAIKSLPHGPDEVLHVLAGDPAPQDGGRD